MRWIALAMAGALCLGGSPARAEWMQASSEHFVIYTDDNERDLRRFSEQLERYHSALAFLTHSQFPPPSPSNRVTVYIVRSEAAVRDLYGQNAQYIGGFYISRAGGSLAIIPHVNSGTGKADFSMIVLLHEYAHHFMNSASSRWMPRWLSEGGAEFFATSSFEADGTVLIGRAAQHRAGELFFEEDMKVSALLDPPPEKPGRRSYDAFYGKSWLLYHYLTFEPTRSEQLPNYLSLLAKGKSQRDAALEAFGDFAKLDKELDRYLMRRRMSALRLTPDMLKVGPIELRKLSPGEAAMMRVRIRSRRGVDEAQAKALVVEARAIAARFPKDPEVLSALAEAEFDAGNDKEAIAAADKALALDPGQVNAYVQKGYALFHMAEDAEDKAAAYKRARAPFIALNRRENDHPLPLKYFYLSFAEQGLEPTPLAIDGLARAVDVARFDLELRMMLATTLIHAKRPKEARFALEPIAYNPHGGSLADSARKMLDRLDKQPGWDGSDMAEVVAARDGEDSGQSDDGQP
ncbi:hypothetical protein ACFB49_27450 [Sphingomonas sp. DBB INV C78]|uniref:hypothetical protein n=1 Tax=Sphingomonas sp. DBB INV C78 TaxID=3349434 RepID=UPI0036D21504